VSLPVTSALIFGRARYMGRIFLSARLRPTPKIRTAAKAAAVIETLTRKRYTRAKTAVMIPPMKSTSPVPIKFRIPSTSLMMRDTSTPVLFAS
jgi:hypothetical protein